MSIGIIGAGNIGQALARRLASAGVSATISNSREPESLSSVVRPLGGHISAATRHQAAAADLVFLAVPWGAHQAALSDLPPWRGRIVIDAMNAASFGPGGVSAIDLGGRPSTRVVASLTPGARVVKAFNTLPAAVLAADPREKNGRRVVVLSGDDLGAKTEVSTLIDALGFVPIDLGTLDVGRQLQQFPGGPFAGLNLLALA